MALKSLPPVDDIHFRTALRSAREARRLTYYALAKRVGISPVMPRRYEEAKHKMATLPSRATWLKLNAVLFPQEGSEPFDASAKAAPAGARAQDGPPLAHYSVEELIDELKRRGAASVSIGW